MSRMDQLAARLIAHRIGSRIAGVSGRHTRDIAMRARKRSGPNVSCARMNGARSLIAVGPSTR